MISNKISNLLASNPDDFKLDTCFDKSFLKTQLWYGGGKGSKLVWWVSHVGHFSIRLSKQTEKATASHSNTLA